MIEVTNLSVLMLGIVGVAVFNLRARSLFSKADASVQKYRLFRVRDNLIHLVAEQKLSEESSVFEFLYHAGDFLIRHTEQINLKTLVRALREAQEHGLDPSAEEKLERLNTQLRHEGPEVRDAVTDFYESVMRILVENSFSLRLVVNHDYMWRVFYEFPKLITRLFSTERDAHGFYQAYRDAQRMTAQGI